MNLDLVDAAAGGEVGGAGGAGAIDLRSGETDEKGQIRRAGAEGLGFRMRPVLAKQNRGGTAARVRACVRTWTARRVGWRLPGVGSESRAGGTAAFRRLRGASIVGRMFRLPSSAANSVGSFFFFPSFALATFAPKGWRRRRRTNSAGGQQQIYY